MGMIGASNRPLARGERAKNGSPRNDRDEPTKKIPNLNRNTEQVTEHEVNKLCPLRKSDPNQVICWLDSNHLKNSLKSHHLPESLEKFDHRKNASSAVCKLGQQEFPGAESWI